MDPVLQYFKEISQQCPIHNKPYIGICGEETCLSSGFICPLCDHHPCTVEKKHKLITIDEFYKKFYCQIEDLIEFKNLKVLIQKGLEIKNKEMSLQYQNFEKWEVDLINKKLNDFRDRIVKKIEKFKENLLEKITNLYNEYKEAKSRIELSDLEIPDIFDISNTLQFIEKNKNNQKELESTLSLIKKFSDNEKLNMNKKDIETIIYSKNLLDSIKNVDVTDKITSTLQNELKSNLSQILSTIFYQKPKSIIESSSPQRFTKDPSQLKFMKDLSNKAQKNYTIDSLFAIYTAKDTKTYLAIPVTGAKIEIYNVKDNILVKTLLGHYQHIYTVRHFLQHSTCTDYLLSASNEKMVKVWNLEYYTCQLTINNCHSGLYLYSSLILFNDGLNNNIIINNDNNKNNNSGGQVPAGGTFGVSSTTNTKTDINKSNDYIVTTCTNEYMKLWDFKTGQFVRDIGSKSDYTYFISSWSYKNEFYIVNANNSNIKIYNIKDKDEKGLFKKFEPSIGTWHMSAYVEKLKCVPHLFESDGNGYFRVWNVLTGEMIRSVQVAGCNLRGICIWNEKFAIAASSDKGFKVIDYENGQCVASIVGHDNVLCSIQKFIHPVYGESLATCGIDGKIKLWTINK